jgi:hypothetical protein
MTDLVLNAKYTSLDYVDVGQKVIAPYVHEGRPTGLWCVVTVAAGTHARVVNEARGFDRWFLIDELRVEVSP